MFIVPLLYYLVGLKEISKMSSKSTITDPLSKIYGAVDNRRIAQLMFLLTGRRSHLAASIAA
jgi:hypothetical protein